MCIRDSDKGQRGPPAFFVIFLQCLAEIFPVQESGKLICSGFLICLFIKPGVLHRNGAYGFNGVKAVSYTHLPWHPSSSGCSVYRYTVWNARFSSLPISALDLSPPPESACMWDSMYSLWLCLRQAQPYICLLYTSDDGVLFLNLNGFCTS